MNRLLIWRKGVPVSNASLFKVLIGMAFALSQTSCALICRCADCNVLCGI